MTASDTPAAPRQTLSTWDGVAFIVGVVIGIGIFKLPSLVASSVSSEAMFIGVWLLGGGVMLVGALCYAELGSAHPDAGGEYHFLTRAFGWRVGILFAWARGTVIQTGAIAAVAFVYADYASNIVPLGAYSAAVHAVTGVVAVTALNLVGTPQGVRAQVTLTILTILALLAVIVAGFSTAGVSHPPVNPASQWGSIGLAMVFVMFAYGGWNEAAYLSGELKDVRRNMVRTLLLGTAVVVALYVLANFAYLNVFGLERLRKSSTVGAELMGVAIGGWGAIVFSIIVCICALSTLNATIFTGARTYYALGRDVPAIRKLGVWDEQGGKPTNALLLQAGIALALLAFGSTTRDGLEAMISYTAPVFFSFMLMIAISLFLFRRRGIDLPYRMPLYPLPPILFGAASAWMIYSTVAYAGVGAIAGIAVLLLGTPLLFLRRSSAD